MSEVKSGLEGELLATKKRLIDIQAENETMKEKLKQLQTQLSKLRKATGTESVQAPEPPKEPTAPSPAPEKKEEKEEPTPHLVKSWFPRFCPDCGTLNPGFKDETKCKTCGIHLGAEENVKANLKACPNCGSGQYERIR
jgi:hypothetical protein